MWPKCAFGDQKRMLFGNPPHHGTKKLQTFQIFDCSFFYFMGQKVLFWVKKRWLWGVGQVQNTPGTPTIHSPLAAASSQSALYIRSQSAQVMRMSIHMTMEMSTHIRIFAVGNCFDVGAQCRPNRADLPRLTARRIAICPISVLWYPLEPASTSPLGEYWDLVRKTLLSMQLSIDDRMYQLLLHGPCPMASNFACLP